MLVNRILKHEKKSLAYQIIYRATASSVLGLEGHTHMVDASANRDWMEIQLAPILIR
ncbi:hypothetical protein BHE74_00055276 [Ensete ventricosum]|nr:hypothetical protein BHE74_00055276 [Ensete ventricosum]